MIKPAALTIFVVLFLLGACVPQSPSNKRTKSDAQTTTTTTTETDSESEQSTPVSEQDLYWYYNSANYALTIRINTDINDIIFLRGQSVHEFLSVDTNFYVDSTQQATIPYCFIAKYSHADIKDQMRFRAIPAVVSRTGERYFTIQPSNSANYTTCSSFTYNSMSGNNLTEVAYSASNLCKASECYTTQSSQSIVILQSDGSVLDPYVNFTGMQLQVDLESSSSEPTTSCTDAYCQSLGQGYDCCLDGQCVNDGATKPNVDTSSAEYIQALAEIEANPNNYQYYKQFFFVCESTVLATPTTAPEVDEAATANAIFDTAVLEWQCLESAKEDPPQYVEACSTAAPEPTANSTPHYTAYDYIKRDVWTRCGCVANPDDPAPFDPENACPDYGLKPIYDTQGNLSEIECDVPLPISYPTPYEGDMQVSARTAPHRFYNATGTPFTDIDAAIGNKTAETATPVEGTPFEYTADEPEVTSFNMNAILGQMALDKSQAIPAVSVPIEYHATYTISINTGIYYSPCPSCASDKWESSYTAFPQSRDGLGVQPIGYSTDRTGDTVINSQYSNYEDMIFGRACWVPPTMLPLAHKKESDLNTQRRNRLSTQAAYFVNGYQRDWFGFNKGAVIGSFDGVTWFAIGRGRRVTSTTDKLYLAINSPYADLADLSNITVNIRKHIASSIVALFDYDPELGLKENQPEQNRGATCQAFHQCDNDADCVTQLGWEYRCANISKYKSYLPDFAEYGSNELTEYARDDGSTFKRGLLLSHKSSVDYTKRCIYRGAGSPCIRNYGNFVTDTDKQKFVTCAPNFYCAGADATRFNKEVVRTTGEPEAIVYGQEANVLGRPKHYHPVAADRNDLSSAIQANIVANLQLFDDSGTPLAAADVGLCRPGKPTNSESFVDAHKHSGTPHPQTDYISQIGGCDSSTTGSSRVAACPIFDDENNLKFYGTGDTEQVRQNSCGKEVQTSGGDNVLSDIEAGTIDGLSNLLVPSLAADACLRRAGSPCNTNLDCSPNSMHEKIAQFLDIANFGGTAAEQKYWVESLVCGQIKKEPYKSNEDEYHAYDLTENRCCRPVGSDITLYTEGYDQVLDSDSYDDTESSSLKTETSMMSYNAPTSDGRYSRYTIVAPLGTATGSDATPYHAIPKVGGSSLPGKFQWKTIHNTAQRTCCGGGWIRKFATGRGGGNNWKDLSKTNINLSPRNLTCLNYPSNFYDLDNTELKRYMINAKHYSNEIEYFCKYPNFVGGCVQEEFESEDAFQMTYPSDYIDATPSRLTTTRIYNDDTTTEEDIQGLRYQPDYNSLSPYMPVPSKIKDWDQWGTPIENNTVEEDPTYLTSWGWGYIYDTYISFYLPAYITEENLAGTTPFKFVYHREDSATVRVAKVIASPIPAVSSPCPSELVTIYDAMQIPAHFTPGDYPTDDGAHPSHRYCSREIDGYDTYFFRTDVNFSNLEITPSQNPTGNWTTIYGPTPDAVGSWQDSGIEISYYHPNTAKYQYNINTELIAGTPATPGYIHDFTHFKAGSPRYYLTKLGRLELLGIPQIFYEPIYCPSNRSEMVPDIFKDADTRLDFRDISTPIAGNLEAMYMEDGNAPAGYDASLYPGLDTNGTPIAEATSAIPNATPGDPLDGTPRVAYANQVELDPVFAPNDFKCCVQLGHKAESISDCCSGYVALNPNIEGDQEAQAVCALPWGTNLNVYFNKFVSGEGMDGDLPEWYTGTGFDELDFIPQTGEIKPNNTAYDKLVELGIAFCETQSVQQGAAFGDFYPEPNTASFSYLGQYGDPNNGGDQGEYAGRRYFGVTDSEYDQPSGDSSNTGYSWYQAGFRWNHHYYCGN